MLEHLIDIIDHIEETLGIDGVYISLLLFKENFSKYLSTVLIEKIYYTFIEKTYEKDEALKFELYSIMILLSKGSFEAKINSKYF